jgi:hypothetical protein
LVYGRVFAAERVDLPLFSAIELVVEHPISRAQVHVPAQVVMVMREGAMRGSALQFAARHPDLAALVSESERDEPEPESPAEPVRTLDACAEASEDEGEADGDVRPAHRDAVAPDRHGHLRNLAAPERLKVARGGTLEERVQLERLYGTAVWEPLLRNPKITVPEVARMARKGTLPKPLLDHICDNEQWVRQSIVRRALLSNPRLSADNALRVLKTLPARELKFVPQQTAYPALVRQVAQRLLKV